MIDGIKLMQNKNGEWEKYDDTYDVVIHCESEEEQERAISILKDRLWIPCQERLPEESDYYMACIYDEDVDDYDFRKTWFAHEDDYDMDESEWRELQPFEKVVAWMPLPEPYRREEQDHEID